MINSLTNPPSPVSSISPASILPNNPSNAPDSASSPTAARAGDAARIARRSSNRLGLRLADCPAADSVTFFPVVSSVTADIFAVIMVLSQDRPLTQTI